MNEAALVASAPGGLPRAVPAEPTPRPAGHVTIAMRVVPVTHLDLTVLDGLLPGQAPFPLLPGTEGMGIVVASDDLPTGARVVVRGAGVGVVRPGTWTTLGHFPRAAVHPCPDDLDDATAAAALAPALTAHAAVRTVAAVRPGENVAVTGATGVVGRMCVSLARAEGAASVIGVVRRRQGEVQPLLDDVLVLPHDAGARSDLAGIDVLIDTVGGPVTPAMLPWMAPGGRIVLVGYTAGKSLLLDIPQVLAKALTLTGLSMQLQQVGSADVAAALADVAAGRLPLGIRAMAVSDIANALATVRAGATGGRRVLDLRELARA